MGGASRVSSAWRLGPLVGSPGPPAKHVAPLNNKGLTTSELRCAVVALFALLQWWFTGPRARRGENAVALVARWGGVAQRQLPRSRLRIFADVGSSALCAVARCAWGGLDAYARRLRIGAGARCGPRGTVGLHKSSSHGHTHTCVGPKTTFWARLAS